MKDFYEHFVVRNFTNDVENDSPQRENVGFVKTNRQMKWVEILTLWEPHVSDETGSEKAGGRARSCLYGLILESVNVGKLDLKRRRGRRVWEVVGDEVDEVDVVRTQFAYSDFVFLFERMDHPDELVD